MQVNKYYNHCLIIKINTNKLLMKLIQNIKISKSLQKLNTNLTYFRCKLILSAYSKSEINILNFIIGEQYEKE